MSSKAEDSDEEYIPPKSTTTTQSKHKRKRKQVSDSSEDDDLQHNDNKPLQKRKKRKQTTKQHTNNEQHPVNNKKRNEQEEAEHSLFLEDIDEKEMIQMTEMVERQFNEQNKNNYNNQCQETECNTITICPMYLKHFGIYVCRECKWKPKYKCLSKTNAKKQYLLSEGDINSLKCWIKEIKKRNESNTNEWMPRYMKLYLIYQLEELSLEKYGSKEGIEAERNRREVNRMQRSISNARKKRKMQFECLDDIEIDEKVIQEHESNTHVHTFGESECVNQETDEWSKQCTECGYVETWEEF